MYRIVAHAHMKHTLDLLELALLAKQANPTYK